MPIIKMRDKETGKELTAMEIDRILDRAALDCAGYEWDIEDDRPDYKMGKYGLTLMGMKNPIYFNSKQNRTKFINKIRGIFTYSTFIKEYDKMKKIKFEKQEIEMKNVSACKKAGGRWNLKKEICLFTNIDIPTRKALNRDTKDTLSKYLYEIFEEYTKREVLDYFGESFRYFEEYTKREVIDYCIGSATKKRLVDYIIDVMDEDRKVGIVQDYFE